MKRYHNILVILMTVGFIYCSRQWKNPFDPVSEASDEWVPEHLTATIITDNSVNLIWDKGSDYPVEFLIERRENYGSFIELARLSTAEYTDQTIIKDNVYTYRVRALAENNVSIASNTQKLMWAEPGYQLWSLDSLASSFHDTLSEMLSVGISYDGSLIATGEEMQTRVWSPESGKLHWSGRINDPGYFVSFRPDDKKIQVGSTEIDIQNLTGSVNDVAAESYCFKYLPDNSGYAYAASKYFYMKFFDGTSEWGKFEEPYYYHFTSVDFHPVETENRLVNGSSSKLVRVYKVRGENWYGDLIWTGTHPAAVTCVVYSPDGNKIAAGSEDGTINIWNSNPNGAVGEIMLTMKHTDAVNHLAYSPDGRMIISGSEDYTLKAWDSTSGSPIWTVNTTQPVRKFYISSDSEFIVALFQDKKINTWSEVPDGYFAVFALTDGTDLWTGENAIDIALSSDNEIIAAITNSSLAVYSTKAKWVITE